MTEALAQGPNDKTDSLLGCLVYLTKEYGQARSAEALKAGLPYDEKGLGPVGFCEAADKIGIKAKIVKKADLSAIPQAAMPVVLMFNHNRAAVMLEYDAKTGMARLWYPETQKRKAVPYEDAIADFNGHVIYVQPRPEFSNPDAPHLQDTDRHWFWGIIHDNRGLYGMVLLAAVIINLFGLVGPLFVMNVYDRVIPNNAIETGWALAIGALGAYIFDLILRIMRAYMIDFAGRRIDVIAARRIYDQVMNIRMGALPPSSGAFANMLKDFDSVRDFVTSASLTILVDLPFTFLFLGVIYILGGPIALLLFGLILMVFAFGIILQVPLKSLVRKSVQSAEAKHGTLIETINGLETIKAIGADGRFRSRYGAYVGENAAYGQQSRFVSGLGVHTATFLQQSASILVVIAGMYLVQDAQMSVGALIACVILGGRAIAPIGQVANIMARYHQSRGALKTLDSIMQKPVERPAHKRFLSRSTLKGNITFQNVGFSYPGTDRAVLETVNFKITAGEKVGLIGRIGSGKSTIARLMLGLYEPSSGCILMDDTDMAQIDPADVRRNTAYIAQDVMLFSGSVRDNITASLPKASEDDILHVSRAAGVHDFIARHPMGYDAQVGERGQNLSGGQRQAIALARAMLLNPPVYVCDEPTNAMDIQAEDAFCTHMETQLDGKTLVLITHRQGLLKLVDRLILMDQSKVILDGPRDDVLKALATGKVEVKK